MIVKIEPAASLNGTIRLPGDKSISHRAAIFSALATGETKIENFATSADCASTIQCLRDLGVEIRRVNSTIFVIGVGKDGFVKPPTSLNCGNSGTTVRLLAGVLAGQNFETTLVGDEILSKRPMRRVVEPLGKMGARFESENNCLPLKISGANPLKAIAYEMPIASAQVKSCVLLAGLNSDGETKVRSPRAETKSPTSRNHTELMLRYLGAEVETKYIETDGDFVEEISINGNARLTAKNLNVPSDVSSAAFFLVAASGLENSEIILENVGLNPTRTAIIDVLKNLGADIEIKNSREVCNEIIGDLLVRGRRNFAARQSSNIIEGEIIGNLIDEIPILAVFGTQIEGGIEIRNAAELRVKESDRIAAMVENLRRMNADVEEFPDGLRVGKSKLKGASVDSFGDHRIAMAMAVAALFADGVTEISGAECAGVSFPEFFETLASVRTK